MEMLAVIFTISSVIVIGLIIWSYTKSGKEWLKSL